MDAIAEIFVLSDSAVQIQVERISLGNTPGRALFYHKVKFALGYRLNCATKDFRERLHLFPRTHCRLLCSRFLYPRFL